MLWCRCCGVGVDHTDESCSGVSLQCPYSHSSSLLFVYVAQPNMAPASASAAASGRAAQDASGTPGGAGGGAGAGPSHRTPASERSVKRPSHRSPAPAQLFEVLNWSGTDSHFACRRLTPTPHPPPPTPPPSTTRCVHLAATLLHVPCRDSVDAVFSFVFVCRPRLALQPEVMMLFDKYKAELKALYKFYSGSSGMTFSVFSQMAKVGLAGLPPLASPRLCSRQRPALRVGASCVEPCAHSCNLEWDL